MPSEDYFCCWTCRIYVCRNPETNQLLSQEPIFYSLRTVFVVQARPQLSLFSVYLMTHTAELCLLLHCGSPARNLSSRMISSSSHRRQWARKFPKRYCLVNDSFARDIWWNESIGYWINFVLPYWPFLHSVSPWSARSRSDWCLFLLLRPLPFRYSYIPRIKILRDVNEVQFELNVRSKHAWCS